MVQCLTASFLLMVLSSPVLIVTVISASLAMAPVIATQRWVLELAVLLSRARTFKQSPPEKNDPNFQLVTVIPS